MTDAEEEPITASAKKQRLNTTTTTVLKKDQIDPNTPVQLGSASMTDHTPLKRGQQPQKGSVAAGATAGTQDAVKGTTTTTTTTATPSATTTTTPTPTPTPAPIEIDKYDFNKLGKNFLLVTTRYETIASNMITNIGEMVKIKQEKAQLKLKIFEELAKMNALVVGNGVVVQNQVEVGGMGEESTEMGDAVATTMGDQ